MAKTTSYRDFVALLSATRIAEAARSTVPKARMGEDRVTRQLRRERLENNPLPRVVLDLATGSRVATLDTARLLFIVDDEQGFDRICLDEVRGFVASESSERSLRIQNEVNDGYAERFGQIDLAPLG